MDWYIVIKKIKGRRYYYRQKTWREGKHVRTMSQYIGPLDAGAPPSGTGSGDAPHNPLATISDQLAAESLQVVMGKKARDWDHHWNANRSGPNQVKRIKAIDDVLAALKIEWTHDSDGAYYNQGSKVVNIPPEECFLRKRGQSATFAYYIVTFHELTHWTMQHVKRKPGSFGGSYAREELVAELGAVMLMRHFGLKIGNEARHALYFQTWLDRVHTLCTRDEALQYAQREAERAVRFILKRGTIHT